MGATGTIRFSLGNQDPVHAVLKFVHGTGCFTVVASATRGTIGIRLERDQARKSAGRGKPH